MLQYLIIFSIASNRGGISVEKAAFPGWSNKNIQEISHVNSNQPIG